MVKLSLLPCYFKEKLIEQKNEIRDILIVSSFLPNVKPSEVKGIAKVNEAGTSLEYISDVFNSQMSLSGEPWKWTGAKGKSILADGKIGESLQEFTGSGTTQEQQVFNKDGNFEMKTVHVFRLTTKEDWAGKRRWILGGNS